MYVYITNRVSNLRISNRRKKMEPFISVRITIHNTFEY